MLHNLNPFRYKLHLYSIWIHLIHIVSCSNVNNSFSSTVKRIAICFKFKQVVPEIEFKGNLMGPSCTNLARPHHSVTSRIVLIWPELRFIVRHRKIRHGPSTALENRDPSWEFRTDCDVVPCGHNMREDRVLSSSS